MPYLLIRHKVNDYDAWKPIYDEDADNRKANGCTGARVFRNANDPHEVIVLTTFDDMEGAQRFTESPGLRERMQRAGVADHPDVFFLDEAERSAY